MTQIPYLTEVNIIKNISNIILQRIDKKISSLLLKHELLKKDINLTSELTSFKTSIYINISFFKSKQKIKSSLQKLKYDITSYIPNINFTIDENNTKSSMISYNIIIYLLDKGYLTKEYSDLILDIRNGGLNENQEVYFFFDVNEIEKASNLKVQKLLNTSIRKIEFSPNLLYDYIRNDYDLRKVFFGKNDKGSHSINYENSNVISDGNSNLDENVKFNLCSYFLMNHNEYNNKHYSIFGNENYMSFILSTNSIKQLEDRYYCQVLMSRIINDKIISHRIFRTFNFYIECSAELINKNKELIDEFQLNIKETKLVPILVIEKTIS